jgi:lipoate-protein ligase A
VSWVRPLADFAVAERGVRELQVAMLEELASVFRMDRPALDVIAAGDWALDGRKCAGSAQRRQKTHVLVHMSLLNQTDLTMISRLLPPPPRMPDYRAERTHDQFLTNFDLPPNRFIERLSDYWPAADLFFDTPLPVKNLTNTLAEDRFRLAEWTMRF